MNLKLKLIAAVVAVVSLMGCTIGISGNNGVNCGDASKATVKKSVKIGKFDKIEARSGICVVFTQGNNTGTAQVATTPSAEKYLVVEVTGNTLRAYYKNHKGSIDGPSIIKVQAPDLKEIDLSSAAQVSVSGSLQVKGNLEIDLSSAASVDMNNVGGNELDIELSSASSFSAGEVKFNKLSIDQSSASSAKIGKVAAQQLYVESSSASDCVVEGFSGNMLTADATSGAGIKVGKIKAQKVSAEATSGASVSLEGECNSTSFESSSGGEIKSRKLISGRKTYKGKSTANKSSSSEKTMPRKP